MSCTYWASLNLPNFPPITGLILYFLKPLSLRLSKSHSGCLTYNCLDLVMWTAMLNCNYQAKISANLEQLELRVLMAY